MFGWNSISKRGKCDGTFSVSIYAKKKSPQIFLRRFFDQTFFRELFCRHQNRVDHVSHSVCRDNISGFDHS